MGFMMTFFFVLVVWHFSTVILKPILVRGVCTLKHVPGTYRKLLEYGKHLLYAQRSAV